MAKVTGPQGEDAHALLRHAGVELREAPGIDVPDEWLVEVLPEGERDVRAEIVADPPAPGAEFEGMGAWHVNAQRECHLVKGGRGLLQVVTDGGIVTVELESGDVMIVRGAEHRYLPVEAQGWVLRWSGAPDAGLDPRETGRQATPWPVPPGE